MLARAQFTISDLTDGRGVQSVDVWYYLSTSSTKQSGGSWSTTAPAWANGKYMWSKTVTTYTNGTSSESAPVCITGAKGATGSTGAAGKGVSSIKEQYYLSASKTAQTGGSWADTPPVWSVGKYMWTRSVITYTDGTTATTTPYCDTGWEAVNELKVGGRNLLRNSASQPTLSGSDYKDVSEREQGKITTLQETRGNAYCRVDSLLTKTPAEITEQIGAEYSFSIDVKVTGSVDGLGAYFDVRTADDPANILQCSAFHDGTTCNQWVRLKGTGAVTSAEGARAIVIILWGSSTAGSTIEYRNLKVEAGNVATDWTPAPEDVEGAIEDVTERVTVNETDILQLGDRINAKVSETTYLQDMAGKVSQSQLAEVRQALTALTADKATVEFVQGKTNDLSEAVKKLQETLHTYFEFNAQGYMEVGKRGNAFTTRLDNEKLAFLQNGREVAYISIS